MRWLVASVIVATSMLACGQDPGSVVSMRVSVSGLSSSEVSSLEAFVFAPRLSDDTILTCTGLRADLLDPRGDAVVTLATGVANVVPGEPSQLRIEEIEEGEDRIVYIESFDANAAQNGRGCVDRVRITGGELTEIEVLVSER